MSGFNDRERQAGRRKKAGVDRLRQRRQLLAWEGSLEDRTLLDGSGWVPTSSNPLDVRNGPLANTGSNLIQLYSEYQSWIGRGGPGQFQSQLGDLLRISGDKVAVDIVGKGGAGFDYGQFVRDLQNVGVQISGQFAQSNLVSGTIPISVLPTVATLARTKSIAPNYKPTAWQQGSANNQADDVFFGGLPNLADQVRAQFGVNGSGIKIGVLSDSVSRFQGGLNDSISKGDLPSMNRITVIKDEPIGPTANASDEGRAMMELIYDIAPGADLMFYTAFDNYADYAAGIRALAAAGATVIVDDVGYLNDSFYQDSLLAQAVADVTAQGVVYLSAFGNSSAGGFDSTFRGSTSAPSGLPAGTYMDFDPGPGVNTAMQVQFTGAPLSFQWDNPYDGVNGTVSTDLDIFFRDANGTIVAQGTANNFATGTPIEMVDVPTGLLTVSILVKSGSAPTRVRFSGFGDFVVDPNKTITFGSETSFSAGFSPASAASGIAVGATNFFQDSPYSVPDQFINSNFSSTGPNIRLFDRNGARLSSPEVRLKPDVSAPQGGNTTFFGNDIPQDPDTLPNFFGTSAAAPNLAAIVALMRQLNPNATVQQIKDALANSATFLSANTDTGARQDSVGRAWNPRGGYGRVNAAQALQNIDQLRIVSTTPGDGTTVTSSPASIDVQFSRAINPASLQASDLQITPPAGVTVAVGTPFFVAGSNNTLVRFPITINFTGASANGAYQFRFADNSVTSTDGRSLVGETVNFTLADTVGPRVTGVSIGSRRISFAVSEALRASTVNLGAIQVLKNGTPIDLAGATLALDPSDANGLKYILDLTNVPQTLLTSGTYELVLRDSITDAVGNKLDGEYTGTFPSGNGTAGGDFRKNLGVNNAPLTLSAPTVTFFGLDPSTDTGILGDENTNHSKPIFNGQIRSDFLGSVANLQVIVQINSRQPGQQLTLGVGANGRGAVGTTSTDLVTTTDSQGRFRIELPDHLLEGFHTIRIVVVGAQDLAGQPGLASLSFASVRTDYSKPYFNESQVLINGGTVNPNNFTQLNSLSEVELNVIDPVLFTNTNLAVPSSLDYFALDPNSANSITNYALIRVADVNGNPTGANPNNPSDPNNFSRFIGAVSYVSTSSRAQSQDPYTGRVKLTFTAGLPAGQYELRALSSLKDSANNSLDQDQNSANGNQPFAVKFSIQSQPLYITGLKFLTLNDPSGATTAASGNVTAVNNPRAYFELPAAGQTPRADAPPSVIQIDFSEQLKSLPAGAIKLIRSGNNGGASDGDFGTGGNTGYTVVPTLTPVLTDGPNGPNTRVELRVSQPLVADYYRVVIENRPDNGTAIRDRFDNLLDGEFLGNETGNLGADEYTSLTDLTTFETLLPNGQKRQNSLSGDLVEGGSFTTGFMVVPNGNIIYARADYVDNPNITQDDPDGSIAKPYPTLAPEAFNNNASNFGTGFRPGINPGQKDINGNGQFDRSAFIAADERVAANGGPVVVVALPSAPALDPTSGQVIAKPFVMQAPSALGADGSASVPERTMLVFEASSVLKMRNASLFVQNQGSAIQFLGGREPGRQVIVTSYADDTVQGDTNRDNALTTARGGDWGGIVLRNYDDVSNGRAALAAQFPVDGKLGLSGADDTLSMLNFATIRYGGGSVPQTTGFRYDAIYLANSRPAITNVTIADTGGSGASQAGISADFDSFREDAIARGPLVRNVNFVNNSLNGLWVRPEANGVTQQTNAIFYQDNVIGAGNGSARNFVFDDPVPYLFLSELQLGTQFIQNGAGATTSVANRLYVQPGMLLKFQRGAGVVVNPSGDARSTSLIVGDRTYISGDDGFGGFDATGNTGFNYGPLMAAGGGLFVPNPNYRANSKGDARVIFTSLFDDLATTQFIDPQTGAATTIVPRIDSDNSKDVNLVTATPAAGYNGPRLQPRFPSDPDTYQPGAISRWGGIIINSGARAVVDEAQFFYGGGDHNTPDGTIGVVPVISFAGAFNLGTRASFTDNDFFDNFEAPLGITPNGMLAGDPLQPLTSGNPFFRGNVFQRNTYNGMRVYTTGQFGTTSMNAIPDFPLYRGNSGSAGNLNVDMVWDDTDLVYILKGTIKPNGWNLGSLNDPNTLRPPSPTQALEEVRPSQTITIASQLPNTMLADGTRIANPGESPIIKLLNDFTPHGNGDTGVGPGATVQIDQNAGAGFILGADDGVDPTADSLYDRGWGTSLRITGIGGNETTGQQRVPVIMTSLNDNAVGRTVRGVDMFDITPFNQTTAAAGDGGVILFGANSFWDYNLLDPRNGNIIDNADLRFMTRIEMQGGGIVDVVNRSQNGQPDAFEPNPNADQYDGYRNQKKGTQFAGTTLTQNNVPKGLTVSNSNLDSFSQVGVILEPGFNALIRDVGSLGTGFAGATNNLQRINARGFANNLFMVNTVVSNTPTGVRVISEGAAGYGGTEITTAPDATYAMLLNNTFYNNNVGVSMIGSNWPPPTSANQAGVSALVMNNIFSNYTTAGVAVGGNLAETQLQYNLYETQANSVTIIPGSPPLLWSGDNVPIYGNPQFRDPANRDFSLTAGSPAIDASRSEIGPFSVANMLRPVSQQLLTEATVGGNRNVIGGSGTNASGMQNWDDFGPIFTTQDIAALPGRGAPLRNFVDQWAAALPANLGGTAPAYKGTGGNVASFGYTPMESERDGEGFQRIDDPSRANTGFGSRPFFDLGAREYRQLFPPKVVNYTNNTAVEATVRKPDGTTSTFDLYRLGSEFGGANLPPESVKIRFNTRLDASTISNQTILLQASGGDGIFGNGNSTADRFIDLSGNLTFDAVNQVLTISLGSFQLSSDLYRITIRGTGANVVRDEQGLALDGENLDGSGGREALPSGDGLPGGNFLLDFTIDTTPPVIVSPGIVLDPPSDTNIGGDGITNDNTPTFTGKISDVFPPNNPLLGQTVILEVSPDGNPNNFQTVGVGTTDANGNFAVTVGQYARLRPDNPILSLGDSPIQVGANGILELSDIGASVARVRVLDQAGNESAPSNTIRFIVDTKKPTLLSSNPAPGTQASLVGGQLVLTLEFSENVDLSSFNSQTIVVTGSGGDGVFGAGGALPDVVLPVGTATLVSAAPNTGRMTIRIPVLGTLANDVYRITLVGQGSPVVRDIAGNGVDPNSPGFSVDSTGNLFFDTIVFDPSLSKIYFVDDNFVPTTPNLPPLGARGNPYSTIMAAMNAAKIGDTIYVLPGVYNESVTMRSMVQVRSAALSSTDTNIVPGRALDTLIRTPQPPSGPTLPVPAPTIIAENLLSAPQFPTMLVGFTIASPLVTTFGSQPMTSTGSAIQILNSDVIIQNNYIINAGTGIQVITTGDRARTPVILSNVIVGNTNGIRIDDASTSLTAPVTIFNNTIAQNTFGALVISTGSAHTVANIANSIFWSNRSLGANRTGAAVAASTTGLVNIWNSMFSFNGVSDVSPADDTFNIGGSFNPAALSTIPDNTGNFVGNPVFLVPRDPRPEANGTAIFLNSANYDIADTSAAIDSGNSILAPVRDFSNRPRVDIAGQGFLGPADIGAFEFTPTSTTPLPSFRITSMNPTGTVSAVPRTITLTFSAPINRASLTASDFRLTGNGIAASNGAFVSAVNFLSDTQVQLTIAGNYNRSGAVTLVIGQGAAFSQSSVQLQGFTGTFSFNLNQGTPTQPGPRPRPRPAPPRPRPAARPRAQAAPRFAGSQFRTR